MGLIHTKDIVITDTCSKYIKQNMDSLLIQF